MKHEDLERLLANSDVLKQVAAAEEVCWINPGYGAEPAADAPTDRDIDDAETRLERFAPYIRRRFPETAPLGGLIESPLKEIPAMRAALGGSIPGRLLLKMDSHLAIAGSVKARGGIYEVLKHAETLAMSAGLLRADESYEKLDSPEFRTFFGRYTVQVGSTGNLGMSIGIMSAALGFHAVVHMSQDARAWKKELLRKNGVTVMEYPDDYGAAVENGRLLSMQNPDSYFVDDENSKDLFLGYAVAARRLVPQLHDLGVRVDAQHPLFVYIPCGVGGAPGGISYGLKRQFGENVHCFFAEPVQAPCMLAGLASGLKNGICVKDLGLSGLTHADGLAVGRPSGLVSGLMESLLSGEFTVGDAKLYDYMRLLLETENVFIEPSACAAFIGPERLYSGMTDYLEAHGLNDRLAAATHIVWATGGSMVPEPVRREYVQTRPA